MATGWTHTSEQRLRHADPHWWGGGSPIPNMPGSPTQHPQPLRVGHYMAREGAPAGRQAALALALEAGGDNPWELDALLAVADETVGTAGAAPPGITLAALRDCLWDPPERDDELTFLIPDLLRRVDERAAAAGSAEGEFSTRARLTLILVKAGRFYAVREGEAECLLLRGGVLRPLRGIERPPGAAPALPSLPPLAGEAKLRPAPEPAVRSGLLEEGDALVVCSARLQAALPGREIVRMLEEAQSPRTAAVRLGEETLRRTRRHSALALLFVGPGRGAAVRAPVVREPEAEPALAAAPAPSSTSTTLLAGMIGALCGCALGVAATLLLIRPQVEAPPAAGPTVAAPVRVDAGPSRGRAASEEFAGAPSPPAQAPGIPPPQAEQPVSPGSGGPGLSSPAGAADPGNVPGAPPMHALARGLTTRVELGGALDPGRGQLILRANQGALYAAGQAMGVPAGQRLAAPIRPLPWERLQDGRAQLRFLDANGRSELAVAGEALSRLLAGEMVRLGEVPPGNYRLVWWRPDEPESPVECTSLRVTGF